jgi:hypothetical protein
MFLQRFRKRGGLSKSSAPCIIELAFEMIDLLTQPFILSPQAIALTLGFLRSLAPISFRRSAVRVVRFRRFRHAPVMPEFTARYKTR